MPEKKITQRRQLDASLSTENIHVWETVVECDGKDLVAVKTRAWLESDIISRLVFLLNGKVLPSLCLMAGSSTLSIIRRPVLPAIGTRIVNA